MNRIYSATYSNVPVYEFNVSGNHVMRRRADDYINATHILKVADYDKPARTRILEREVQKGTHEKIQGGYGKYQGTWIPLVDGRSLAERNGCLEKLLPIFDFVPGDRSPPPAPKHATAASGKPRVPRQSAPARRVPVPPRPQVRDVSYDDYVPAASHESPTNETVSESEDELTSNAQYTAPRKRRRQEEEPQVMSAEDQQHIMWSDELLDYFMLQKSDEPLPPAPEPSASIDLNRPVDDKGHSPVHWAAAMGDLKLVTNFHQAGAKLDALTLNGETPLMRAVTFTNNWDRQTMARLIDLLHGTVGQKDWFGSTVFHHIAVSTCSKSKYGCAKYYLDTILHKLAEIYPPRSIHQLLDQQDHNGDTAIMLAARFGARKCVRTLSEYGANVDIPNTQGQTAGELIKELNARRRDRFRPGSSSPIHPPNGTSSQQNQASQNSNGSLQSRHSHYLSEAATLVASQLPTLIASRTEALAAAMESEIMQREQEAHDSEELLKHRRDEIAKTRKTIAELSDLVEDGTDDITEGDEFSRLLEEAKRFIESEQTRDIQNRIHAELAEMKDPSTATVTDESEDPIEKGFIARQLQQEQVAHADLCREFALAQSASGSRHDRNHQDVYKRLITGALGIRVEDVEAMLPDILTELEEGRGDKGVVGSIAAASGNNAANGHASGGIVNDGTPSRFTKLGMFTGRATGVGEVVGVMG